MKSTVCKVLITNIVSLNTGDAAILWGMIEILKKKYGPNTEIIVFDKEAEVAQKYYPWAIFRQAMFYRPSKGWLSVFLARLGYDHWNMRIRYLRIFLSLKLIKHSFSFLLPYFLARDDLRDLKEYASADLILSTGGTYLTENYGLLPAIMDYRLSIASGKPFGFFTQTLGPFKDPKNRSAFRKIFSKADLILLRDERSKNHIKELGVIPRNIQLAADAAFVLARKRNNAEVKNRSSADSIRLAISVRSMKFFERTDKQPDKLGYFDTIVLATKVAVEEYGAKVTFLSTCQGIPEYWTNDADTADEICAMLPKDIQQHVVVDRNFRQPWEIIDAYETYDAVISTRMHSAILSMCAGTPTLGIAYEFKMEELFKNIGMSELVLSLHSIEVSDVKVSVRKLLSERNFYRNYVVAAAENMCTQAWLAENALL